MALKQRISRPFGRNSPVYSEQDAMAELVKLVRENVTHKYQTGWAIRTRSCDGKTRVEMLDGVGGAAEGYAKACEDSESVGSAGVSEVWWSQRSEGRTVRLNFDGPRGSRGTIVRTRYPAATRLGTISGRVTVAATGLGLAGVTVSDGTRTATTNASGYYTIAGVPKEEEFTVTPTLSGWSMTPTTEAVTVDTLLGTAADVDFTAAQLSARIAVGTGTTKYARSMDNGETWAALPDETNLPGTPYAIAYGGGKFVVGGKTTDHIAYSIDSGATWTGCGTVFGAGATDGPRTIAYNGTVFVASGVTSTAGKCGMAWSSNGIDWNMVDTTSLTGFAGSVDYLTTWGTAFIGWVGGKLIGYSVDGGQTWSALAIPGETSTGSPVGSDGTSYSQPTYSPLAGGTPGVVTAGTLFVNVALFADAVSESGWDEALGEIDVLILTANGDHADDIPNVCSTTPAGGLRSIAHILWDGTQYVAALAAWDGSSLGWIATSTDGVTWTNYLGSGEAPGAVTWQNRLRYIDGRYFVCGDLSANISIAYSDDPTTGWVAATAVDPLLTVCLDIAGEE